LVEHIAANADLGCCRIEHDPPFMDSNGLGDKNNRELAERVATLAREMGRDAKLVGVPYGTDAAAISAVDVPTVVFGPGAIAQAHTADEFIEIDQLERGAELFYRIAMGDLSR
jgi:acetylornithine deacetylase